MSLIAKGNVAPVFTPANKIEEIYVGLGWDEIKPFEDMDLHAYLFSKDNEFIGKLSSKSEDMHPALMSLTHSGDNPSGFGDGDDEVISIHLDKITPDVQFLFFKVTSESSHNLSDKHAATVRLFKKDGSILAQEKINSAHKSEELIFCGLGLDNAGVWHVFNTSNYAYPSDKPEEWPARMNALILDFQKKLG
jgi:stress response protein SCP2